ncbi:hypothetical protein C427_4665 [Paraglaciecola psychrophila 170]|uniref:Uncharacterized protein n=1 Tax=Paraglaciecola psychrophila 170 TaxID=1129794 RepID=M4RX03_9ALTE|nr:hypothetical protein C427_4665 [Paraglaciecola psychrophila 170]
MQRAKNLSEVYWHFLPKTANLQKHLSSTHSNDLNNLTEAIQASLMK